MENKLIKSENIDIRDILLKPCEMTYKPLLNNGWRYACPNCGFAVGENVDDCELQFTQADNYCPHCGQKLDWSDVK